MLKGVCYIFPGLIMCLQLNLRAQTDIIKADTSGYLPLFISGALEYNLMLAASAGYHLEVERMILMGADVDSETSEGVTPLIYAVYNNRPATVTTLLQLDADVNHITGRRETPLLIAVKNESFEIAEILIRYGADVNYQGSFGAAPLHFASIYGFLPIADLLLYYDAEIDIRTTEGTTPLMAAIWAGYHETANLLIHYGANIEARDNEGFTPFLIASQNGDTLTMSILREKGVDIYQKNISNWDALNLTIRSGQKEAAGMLLRIGNRWSDPVRDVISPYSVAIAYRQKEMIALLRENDFPAITKPGFDQVAFSGGFRSDFRDFYSGFAVAFKEPLRNMGIITGFDTKLWYTRVLIRQNENLFYQYYDKSSLVYAGLLKEWPLTDNFTRSNYSVITSLSAGYSFGNKLKGTLIVPENKLRLIPAAGIMWTSAANKTALFTNLEFTDTGFYKIGPLWWRFGFSYNFFFNNVRAPLKDIKWY